MAVPNSLRRLANLLGVSRATTDRWRRAATDDGLLVVEEGLCWTLA